MCWMAVQWIQGLAIIYVSSWFVVPFFSLIFFFRYIFGGIKCPNCGTPVTYQGAAFGFRISAGFVRRKCQECGWDLDKHL